MDPLFVVEKSTANPHSKFDGVSGRSNRKRPAPGRQEQARLHRSEHESADDVPEELPSQRSQDESDALHPKKRRRSDQPVELPAKKPVPYMKPAVTGPKFKARDPRFDDMCGQFNNQVFKSSYKFLYEQKQAELAELQKALKKQKDPDQIEELKRVVDRYKQELSTSEAKEKERQRKSEWRKKEAAQVERGKKPFFLRKSDQKRLALVDKFQELEKSGRLEKFLASKRRRNAAKERRWLPDQR